MTGIPSELNEIVFVVETEKLMAVLSTCLIGDFKGELTIKVVRNFLDFRVK
jgi:hypothetical protein